MKPQNMWQEFTAHHPDAASASWEAWAYGDAPDQLAALTLAGVKTATSSLHAAYACEGEALPKAGEYSIILDSHDNAVCITRCTRVRILPYREVDEDHARREGEGDGSLAYWRKVHEAFFRKELNQISLPFTEEIAVVCEEFEVVYP